MWIKPRTVDTASCNTVISVVDPDPHRFWSAESESGSALGMGNADPDAGANISPKNREKKKEIHVLNSFLLRA
jgi:hypothetical protein